MKPSVPPSGRSRHHQKIIGYVLPGLILGVVTVAVHVAEARFGAPPWVLPAATALVFIGVTPLLFKWWNTFDEVAKDAHRDSCLWGGTAGLCVSVVILSAVTNYAEALRLADVGPIDLFVAGFASVFVPLMLGYLIWWAAWWMKRR